MNDTELVEQLRADMARATAHHYLNPSVAAAVLTPAKRIESPVRTRWAVAAAAAVVVAATVLLSVLVPSTGRRTASNGGGCGAVVARILPVWARAGFSPGAYRVPYVMGAHGRIVAILFTNHLYAPPRTDPHNKVLWVARGGGFTPLVIRASLPGGRTVRRVLPGGPGPSYVNLPEPGCWHLSLRWGGSIDQVNLQYVNGHLPH